MESHRSARKRTDTKNNDELQWKQNALPTSRPCDRSHHNTRKWDRYRELNKSQTYLETIEESGRNT